MGPFFLILLFLYPMGGNATRKGVMCTSSGTFQEGRCYQACLDEENRPGKLDAKGECFCYSPMPLSYMNAKKYKAKVTIGATTEEE